MKKLCWLFITFFIVGLNEVGLSQDLPESKERQSSENQTLTKEAPASKDAPAPEEPSFSKTSHIELNFSGEMSIWGSNFKKNKTYNTYGARYLPLLTAKVPLGEDYNLDAQASVNILLNKKFESATRYEIERKLDLYRFTARVFSQAQEVRFGLQRINFGPGKILRAMQWFDNINPTDVTNFTEGVWGGLFRKYFENNANIWAWSLLNNENPVGPIPLVGKQSIPEFGGRVQYPVPLGEVGISYHHRKVDTGKSFGTTLLSGSLLENRVGLDGMWDIGPGVWSELCYISTDSGFYFPKNVFLGTVGSDYTFGIGNGIYTSLEFMYMQSGKTTLTAKKEMTVVAFSPTYSLGLLDQIRLVEFYNLTKKGNYLYIDWQRKYDNFLISAGLFQMSGMVGNVFASPVASTKASQNTTDLGFKLLLQLNH